MRFVSFKYWALPGLVSCLLAPAVGAQDEAHAPGAAASAESECRYAEIQASDVDLDEPQKQLGKRVALDVPPDAVIGSVTIESRQIFDLSETGDGWLYRWGNRLHALTRDDTVEAQLLFQEGEEYDPDVLEQTERALRGQPYLLDAWVQPYRVCGNRVDVVVATRDLWTLQPEIGYSRSGGETKTNLGISDNNFLGLGKEVELTRETGPDRDSTFFQYVDPNVMGSHWQGRLRLADNSDGDEQVLEAERPFYRFGTKWSYGFNLNRFDRIEDIFFRGDEVNSFRQAVDHFNAFGGLSLGVEDRTDKRLLFGYSYEDHDFDVAQEELPPPEPFPDDRTLSYPWIGFEVIENRFVETMNLTRIQRIEDVRDGIQFRARLGFSSTGLGGDEDRLVLENEFSNAVVAYAGHLVDYRLAQRGWYNTTTDEFENFEVEYGMRYFHGGVKENRAWFAELELAAAENFTPDRQFYIGGSTGLRGYPFRYQRGDRRARLTVERRYYSNWHPWDLFRVGGVAFFDIGRAWFSDRDNGPNDGFLKDVGVGLRIASDRFETGQILHLDLAFPLDGGDDIDDVQFLVRGRTTF